MEQGKIYFVEEVGFWMVGRCEGPIEENGTNCPATTISSNKEFRLGKGWCFQHGKNRTYRDATQEEIAWYEYCEKNEKFISQKAFMELKPNYQIF